MTAEELSPTSLMKLKSRTFFLLKPDCLQRNLVSKVQQKLTVAGFQIERRCRLQLHMTEIEEIYDPFTLAKTPEPHRIMKKQLLTKYMTAGFVIYLLVRATNVPKQYRSIFDYARNIQGLDYYPERCSPGSLRYDLRDKKQDGKWTTIDYVPGFGDVAGEIVYNLVHTPSNYDEHLHQNRILQKLAKKIVGKTEGAALDIGQSPK